MINAQNEGTKWYFGYGSALDFMTTPPTVLANSSMSVAEGCASLADASGNLLFYTNGMTLWTSTHTVMANGSGLMGNGSPSQSSLFIKKPGSTSQYYLFTLQVITGITGLYYHVIDMSLAAGHGSVIVKNAPVYLGYIGEKLTGTKHCNGTDYWVVIRDWNNSGLSRNFRSYLVNAVGVNTTAVVSPAWSWTNTAINYWDYGCMKISPNGKKLGTAVYNYWNLNPNSNYHAFELYDFNNSTGAVTNSVGLAVSQVTLNNWHYGYGCEFSPDGTKFYGSKWNNNVTQAGGIYQWDLCAGSNSAIAASIDTIVASTYTLNNWNYHASMQIAPNGKIYIAHWVNNQQTNISVINNPNLSGAACGYSAHAQSVAPGMSYYGLPNFVNSMFAQHPPVAPFTHTVSNAFYGCQGVGFTSPAAPNTTVNACSTIGYSLTSLVWDFGDPASGSGNTSTATNPVHAFTNLGTYTVQLVLYYSCGGANDTLRQVVNVNQPCISVVSNSITCASLGSATVTSNGGVGPFSYTWMPSGQASSVATGLSPGTYTLTVFDFGNNFTYTTTTVFTSLIPLTGSLSHASSVTCNGANTASATVTNLAGGSGTENYLWVNGAKTHTTNFVNSLGAGTWTLLVTDNLTGCTINDTFAITQPPAMTLQVTAGSPSACVGVPITLSGINSGGTPGYSYTWTAGPVSDTHTVVHNAAGHYTYQLNSLDANNCPQSNTVGIDYIPEPVLSLPSVSICPLETGLLQVSGATTYTWSGNHSGSTFTASPPVSSIYFVTGAALGCTSSASAFIYVKPVPVPVFFSNGPICNGQSLLLSGTGGQSYNWTGPQNFTSTSQSPSVAAAIPAGSGLYSYTVTAANSCTATQSGTVLVHPTPTISALGSTVCIDQPLQLSAASEPGVTYLWKGPQSFTSAVQNPVVAQPPLSMTGDYSVHVQSVAGCTNMAVAHGSVAALPVPDFSHNAPLCSGEPLRFNAKATSGAEQYSWIGPANFSASGSTAEISQAFLQNAGDYTLAVTAGPCSVLFSKNIIVNPLPVPVITGPVSVCETKSISLTADAPSHTLVAYQWVYPGGFSGQQTIIIDSTKIIQSGVYSATVTDHNGCRGGVSSSVTILTNPVLTVFGDTVCRSNSARLTADGAVAYQWYGANLQINTGKVAHVSEALNVQPEKYTVMGTAVNGCTSVASAYVLTTDLPTPRIASKPSAMVCVGQILSLKGTGGEHYQWLLPNMFKYVGREISVDVSNHTYGGDYTLTVTDKRGCINSTVKTMQVAEAPEGSLASTIWSGCAPFCSEFTFNPAAGNTHVRSMWSLNGRTLGDSTFKRCFVQAGEYVVNGKLTDTLTGCVNTKTFVVSAYSQPVADFTWLPENPVEGMDEVQLLNQTKGAAQSGWKWYVEGADDVVLTEHHAYTFPGKGNYRVVYIVENGLGCADTVIKVIDVRPDYSFFVPDVFTPNGDGLNDLFLPVTRGVTDYRLEIFDRWGERLFLSLKAEEGWDGNFNGEFCKEGVYVWKVVLENGNKEQRRYTGHLVLYR